MKLITKGHREEFLEQGRKEGKEFFFFFQKIAGRTSGVQGGNNATLSMKTLLLG